MRGAQSPKKMWRFLRGVAPLVGAWQQRECTQLNPSVPEEARLHAPRHGSASASASPTHATSLRVSDSGSEPRRKSMRRSAHCCTLKLTSPVLRWNPSASAHQLMDSVEVPTWDVRYVGAVSSVCWADASVCPLRAVSHSGWRERRPCAMDGDWHRFHHPLNFSLLPEILSIHMLVRRTAAAALFVGLLTLQLGLASAQATCAMDGDVRVSPRVEAAASGVVSEQIAEDEPCEHPTSTHRCQLMAPCGAVFALASPTDQARFNPMKDTVATAVVTMPASVSFPPERRPPRK